MRITVSIADDHMDRIDEVVGRLEAAGMQVEQVLAPIGMITGIGDQAVLEGLAGVAAVETQHGVTLPPPDAEVQ